MQAITICVVTAASCLAQGFAQSPLQSQPASSVPTWFAHCAGENGQCSFTGPAQVVFGTAVGNDPASPPNGKFFLQTLSGGTVCSNSVFGDPASGATKGCWVGPIPGLGQGSIVQAGGSNYPFYIQNSQTWDDNQRVVVGLYHLNPTLVEAQLRQLYQSGQRKIALFIWYMPFNNPLSPQDGIQVTWPDVYEAYVDSSGGQLSFQAQSNLQSILKLLDSIGFTQVTLRLAPAGAANPRKWADTWNEAAFEQDEQFVFNTRQLMENSLAGSSMNRVYDLGVELGGVPHNPNPDGVTYTDGQSPAWTSRLWSDYVRLFGNSDSYGFSIAYSYGTLASAIAEYDVAGVRPNSYGLDIYDTGQVWNVYQELLAAGESAKPVIVQEAPYNDTGIMQDIQTALQHIPLTISYIDEWPANSSNGTADGMTPPTNYNAYGGSAAATGTLVGYPCAIPAGQSTCTTPVSWATSNSANVALYVDGNQAANLPNVTSGLSGTATVTLSSTPTTLIITQSANGLAGPTPTQNIVAQMSLAAVQTPPPALSAAGLGGDQNKAVWALGSNISAVCTVNLYDANGSGTSPVAVINYVTCQSNSLSFQLPTWVVSSYAAINLDVVDSNGLASGYVTVTLRDGPSLTNAGLGGDQNQAVWALGTGISTGCAVNLYNPSGSATAPITTVNAVNCQPTNLSFQLPNWVANSYSKINFAVVNPDGLSSGYLPVTLHAGPSLTDAGLGGDQNQAVWALGTGISTGCAVNLYDPNGSATAPITTINAVNCQPTSLSFQIPNWVANSYSAINFSVFNPDGLSSGYLRVTLQSVPSLTNAGLGGDQNQAVWALGTGISTGCAVNLYDPNGSATAPITTINAVNCQPTSLSFQIPNWVANSYSAINFSVFNPDGLSSGVLTVPLQ